MIKRILLTVLCTYMLVLVTRSYVLENNLYETSQPIDCNILSKHCKRYSSDVSTCIVLYQEKKYDVEINNCSDLKTGFNNTNFYYYQTTDEVFYYGDITIYVLVLTWFVGVFLLLAIWGKIK